MSADSWTTCPRCTRERDESIAREEQLVAQMYGKVTVAEFDRAREALEHKKAQAPEETWREDYEFFGADEGTVVAVYGGSCSACGLTHKFRYESPIQGVS